MNNLPMNISMLLENNEQLNIELLETQLELRTLELNNLITNMEIRMEDKETIIRYLEGKA